MKRAKGEGLLSARVLRILKWAIFTLVLLFILFMMIFGDGGYWEKEKIVKENEKILQKIKGLNARKAELQETLKRLKRDEEYMEKVLREEYGWIKDGEKIFLFREEDPDQTLEE